MKTQTRTALFSGVLAIVGWLGTVQSTEAAVYRGRFDPLYGQPFSDPAMAWRGSLKVTVDDNCVNPGTVFLLLNCGLGGFHIDEVSVELFKVQVTDPGNPPTTAPTYSRVTGSGALSETLDFGSTSGISGLNWALQFDANEKLIGASTTAFAAIKGDPSKSGDLTKWNNVDAAWFSIQFLGDYAQLYWFKNQPGPEELALLTDPFNLTGHDTCRVEGGVVIPGIPFVYNGNRCGWSNPDYMDSQRGAFITFEQVPEPATLALVPTALMLAGILGRRAKRRLAPSLAR